MAKKEKDPAKVILSSLVVCFPHLKKPQSFEDSDKEEYSIEFLVPVDHPDVDKILDAIDYTYESNKESKFNGAKMTGRNFHNPFRDGDEILEEYPKRTEVEGHYVLKAKTTNKPMVYDENGDELYDLDDIYSGCICRGVVVFRPFAHKSGKKGISCYLNSVKFMEEGERIGGFSATHDDYDEEDDAPRRKTSRTSKRRNDDDEDEKPRRRTRSRDDDEDDEPAPRRNRKASRDDDEEEEKPRRRSSRRDEEDDEPPRRSRRSSRDDDEEEAPRRRRSSRRDEDDDLAD